MTQSHNVPVVVIRTPSSNNGEHENNVQQIPISKDNGVYDATVQLGT